MELNLDKYKTDMILASYEFIFAQCLGGQMTPPDMLEKVPTVYIFGEICTEMRAYYLARKDASVDLLKEVENNCVVRISQAMNLSEEELREACEKMLANVKEKARKTIGNG